MAFILKKDRPEIVYNSLEEAWEHYTAYLNEIKESLPESAREFALASWHYDFQDSRAPHDGWLESLVIREPFNGDRFQYRSVEISIRLLGAYHDGHIEITYPQVGRYSLSRPPAEFPPEKDNQGHNDWLYDEVRLLPDGNVLHEIEWRDGSRWLIESKDILYKWLPF